MSGIINFFSKLFGNKYDKDIKKISPIVSEINVLFSELKNISNDELREKTLHFKEQIKTITNEIKKLFAKYILIFENIIFKF